MCSRGSQLQGKKSKYLETHDLDGICPAEEPSGTFQHQLRPRGEPSHPPNLRIHDWCYSKPLTFGVVCYATIADGNTGWACPGAKRPSSGFRRKFWGANAERHPWGGAWAACTGLSTIAALAPEAGRGIGTWTQTGPTALRLSLFEGAETPYQELPTLSKIRSFYLKISKSLLLWGLWSSLLCLNSTGRPGVCYHLALCLK